MWGGDACVARFGVRDSDDGRRKRPHPTHPPPPPLRIVKLHLIALPVILSAAKNLKSREILRCAQNDMVGPILVVTIH